MAYMPVHGDGFGSFSGSGEYRGLVSMEAVNLEEGDTLAIRYRDVVVKVR